MSEEQVREDAYIATAFAIAVLVDMLQNKERVTASSYWNRLDDDASDDKEDPSRHICNVLQKVLDV